MGYAFGPFSSCTLVDLIQKEDVFHVLDRVFGFGKVRYRRVSNHFKPIE
jgi:hypothetical protein